MRRHLAQVSDAAFGHVTGQDGRREALRQVQLPVLVLRQSVLVVLRSPGVPLLPRPPALQQHPRPGGHAGVGVYAAVRGRPLDVGEAQHLRVHQVPGAEVLVVTVAGGVAREGVAARVARVFIAHLLQEEEEKKKKEVRRGQTEAVNIPYGRLNVIVAADEDRITAFTFLTQSRQAPGKKDRKIIYKQNFL